MQLIVPFAAPLSDAGRDALQGLRLPQLSALMARWASPQRDVEADEFTLNTPHERALARALGWPLADGALPVAAHAAVADGLRLPTRPTGLLSPVHQQAGAERVSLFDPSDLALDEAASRELFAIVQPWFDSLGFALHWGAPARWYVQHDLLATLATASLDRVAGRHINPWLPLQREAPLLRQVQSELQMLLYTHAFNDAREAAGALPVNALWLSGTGPAVAPAPGRQEVQVDDRLRRHALREDWPAWLQAWQALDAQAIGPLLARGQPGDSLTLAGERSSASFHFNQPGLLARLTARWRARPPAALLETL
ncbi:hypothetical protein BurJ1DRAFT_1758 [Burkholderiales bacterium JOSHI_001]|nr:hypothetical protein BurJ1DRAFT_1758 [Burkholderiales bacterium JOSHI_001]